MTKEQLRKGAIRVGLDVAALALVLVVLWAGFVVWTRARNGETAYECAVLHLYACPTMAPQAPGK